VLMDQVLHLRLLAVGVGVEGERRFVEVGKLLCVWMREGGRLGFVRWVVEVLLRWRYWLHHLVG